jgi:hypothetical protein
MRTKLGSAVTCLLLALLTALSGCSGGSGSINDTPPYTPPSPPAFTPIAKFTINELIANSIFATGYNKSGFITAYTFSPNGTVTKALNMPTASISSASENLSGTYYIDNSGIIIIDIPLKSTEKIWKTTPAADEYNSFAIGSNHDPVIARWFFEETLGADQALAFSQGVTIPLATPTAPSFKSSNSTVFTVGSPGTFAIKATGIPTATYSVNGNLPNGISFNQTTGKLSGTPTTAGSYPLTFTASNGVLPNATQNFTLTVTTVVTGNTGQLTVNVNPEN